MLEMDVGEVPPTGVSAPEQAPAPPATMLAIAGIWVGGPSGQVAEPGASVRGLGERCPPDRRGSHPRPR